MESAAASSCSCKQVQTAAFEAARAATNTPAESGVIGLARSLGVRREAEHTTRPACRNAAAPGPLRQRRAAAAAAEYSLHSSPGMKPLQKTPLPPISNSCSHTLPPPPPPPPLFSEGGSFLPSPWLPILAAANAFDAGDAVAVGRSRSVIDRCWLSPGWLSGWLPRPPPSPSAPSPSAAAAAALATTRAGSQQEHDVKPFRYSEQAVEPRGEDSTLAILSSHLGHFSFVRGLPLPLPPGRLWRRPNRGERQCKVLECRAEGQCKDSDRVVERQWESSGTGSGRCQNVQWKGSARWQNIERKGSGRAVEGAVNGDGGQTAFASAFETASVHRTILHRAPFRKIASPASPGLPIDADDDDDARLLGRSAAAVGPAEPAAIRRTHSAEVVSRCVLPTVPARRAAAAGCAQVPRVWSSRGGAATAGSSGGLIGRHASVACCFGVSCSHAATNARTCWGRVCWIHLSAEAWVAGMSAETSRQHHAE